MRTFAQKPKATQQTKSAKSTTGGQARSAQGGVVNSILHLQRTIGNQAVQRLLEKHTANVAEGSATTKITRAGHDFSPLLIDTKAPAQTQAKLTVNSPGDVYEQKADEVSERVMRMPEPQLQRSKCQTEQLGWEHERLQTKHIQSSDSGPVATPPIVHDVLRSPGQKLDRTTRAFMEPRFGQDLSQVRVHADRKSADSARALDALAYTVGRDVVFGAGQYATGSSEGRQLIAHELTHVVQQGFTSQAIQRKPDPKPKPATTTKPKPATTTPQLVYDEIKKRNPDLAELITPGSINRSSPTEPPAIKGGPMQNGEEHIWKVTVLSAQGFAGSQIVGGRESRKKVRGGEQITHFLDITWALPIGQPDPEYVKLTSSADEAFTLTAAGPLYHELLHARLMMERDPHWTGQHTQVFQDFTNILQIANSPAVDKERQALKQEIGQMAAGGGRVKDTAHAQDQYYEFLVHEKFDAGTAGKAFGKTYANALIAKNYSEVVALRLGAKDFPVLRDKLAAAAEKLFDKLDQAANPSTPSTAGAPASSPPPTKQPEK